MNYTYDSDETLTTSDGVSISVRKYVDGGSLMNDETYGPSTDGTMNVAPAYNLNLVLG